MIDKNYDCLYSYCSYIYRYSLSTTRRFRMSFIMTIGHSFKWSKLCLKTEVQNFPKNRKFLPPRKFFQEISPSCFIFTAHTSTLFDTKYKSKSMATFCSVRYCSYNIGILSNCSFLKRFKTADNFFTTKHINQSENR